MPYQKIILRPGVNVQATPLLNEASLSVSNLIRIKDGILQKLGGWQRLTDQALTGVCRGMLAWADLVATPYAAFGTDQRLEIYYGGSLYDITPIRKTDNLTAPMDSTMGSPTITVDDTTHEAVAGDTIHIITPAAIGGIVVQGYYVITSIIDADHYTFDAASNALSSESSGGTVAEYNVTMGSGVGTVTLVNHGLSVGGIWTENISLTVGGLTFSGDYIVQSVPDADTFTIDEVGAASSTDSAFENGGNVRIDYLLPSGLVSNGTVSGFGEGGFGLGPYGVGSSSATVVFLRQWSLGAWGQQLIANPTNLGIYVWDPSSGVTENPATLISAAPAFNTGMFIAMPQQQIISYGAEDANTGDQDPMLVRWCEISDYNDWTPSATNQAGSFRLPRGSRIVGGIQGPLYGLLWTDLGFWVMQYLGFPLVYGFNEIAVGCGLMAMRAMGILAGSVYWMSQNGFFVYGGGAVNPLPCAVWDIIFRNLNTFQVDKITCAVNSYFNEIAWHFPALNGNGENDTYVKYNAVDKVWDYGSITRTAWTDQSIFGPPMGVDGNSMIQQHETSTDADGIPLMASATTGWFKLADGLMYIFLERLIPDFILSSGTMVQITVYVTDYPDDNPSTFGPFNVTSSTEYIIIRARGRLAKLQISSADLGSFWRQGEILSSSAPAGRR